MRGGAVPLFIGQGESYSQLRVPRTELGLLAGSCHPGRWTPLSLLSLLLPPVLPSFPHPLCVIRVLRGAQSRVSLKKLGQSTKLLPTLRGEMRPWSSPPQLGAGDHLTGQGNPSGPRPVPPPRLRRASSRRDPPCPRPAEPALEMVGSKCHLGTPAASLCPADSPSQYRAMLPGPASRANVSGFCFLMDPGSGTERA